jgi:hypothetical protein
MGSFSDDLTATIKHSSAFDTDADLGIFAIDAACIENFEQFRMRNDAGPATC